MNDILKRVKNTLKDFEEINIRIRNCDKRNKIFRKNKELNMLTDIQNLNLKNILNTLGIHIHMLSYFGGDSKFNPENFKLFINTNREGNLQTAILSEKEIGDLTFLIVGSSLERVIHTKLNPKDYYKVSKSCDFDLYNTFELTLKIYILNKVKTVFKTSTDYQTKTELNINLDKVIATFKSKNELFDVTIQMKHKNNRDITMNFYEELFKYIKEYYK